MSATDFVLSYQEVPDRVTELAVPVLASNAQRTEAERRVPAENIEALKEAGLLRLMAPQRYGGLEADWKTNAEALARVGSACGSTAWVLAVSLAGQYMVGWLSEEAQDEIFADSPDQLVTCVPTPGGTAAKDGDDWILSGRWPFSSGSLNDQWLGQGAVIGEENGQPVVAYCVFPSSEATFEDTWHVSGLSGTGSVTVVADRVRVPARRVIRTDDILAERYHRSSNTGNPRWNAPWIAILSAGSLGAPVGIARGAYDAFMERLPGRAITYTHYTDQAVAPVTHLSVGRVASKLAAAEALMREVCDAIDRRAQANEPWSLTERAKIRSHTAYSIMLARESTQVLFEHSGASSIQLSVKIQRSFRDLMAISNHALLTSDSNFELYGRVLCGGEAFSPYI